MNNWKKLSGSVVLAALLFSGCNSDSDNNSNDADAVVETPSTDAPATKTPAAADESTAVRSAAETEKSAAALYVKVTNNGEFSNLNKAKWAEGDFDDKPSEFMTDIINDGLADGTLTQAEADALLATDLNQAYIDLISAATTSSVAQASQRGLGSLLKDAINKLAATDIAQKLGGAAFDVVLDSEGVTVVMLDAARGSRTVTDMMIDILGDQKNWNDITPKMYPMLRENSEFGEKFAALAWEMNPETKDGAPAMGRFFFSMTDRGMYDALADAMVLSDGTKPTHDSVEMSVTGYMGALMKRHAKQFFITPGTGVAPDLSTASGATYGRTDAFANLMFDTGAPISFDENETESGHGDASELANEKFFYAMFRTPTSTGDFVTAMEELDQATVTMFMDQIFLGQGIDANVTADSYQGYYNIVSIAGAMNEGVNAYGMQAYYSSFVGFAGLIQTDRFYPYAKAFLNAGYNFVDVDVASLWSMTKDGAYSYVFGEDNATTEANATEVAQAKSFREVNATDDNSLPGTIGTSWSGVVWDCSVTGWDNLNLWDSITGVFYEDDNATASAEDVGAMDSFSTCFHDSIELAVREDLVNDSLADSNASNDLTLEEATAQFTLPNFTDITFKYVYTGAYDRAALHAGYFYDNTLGDISSWWSDFSLIDSATGAYEYTKGFVWDSENSTWSTSEQRWAYFPNWLADTQWLDLAEYYSSGTSTLTIDFDSGYVDFYVISRDANLTTTVAGLSETMTRVETEDLPLSVQKDLNIDDAEDTDLTEFYVYTIRITDTTGLDEILAQLEDYISGFGADTTNASNDANTTAE